MRKKFKLPQRGEIKPSACEKPPVQKILQILMGKIKFYKMYHVIIVAKLVYKMIYYLIKLRIF